MKEPSAAFLIELCTALREAEYKDVAGHFCAGFLWTLYPEWYDKNFGKQKEVEAVLKQEYESTFGKRPSIPAALTPYHGAENG